MLMDGMAMVDNDPEIQRMPFTTFERVKESQLGSVGLHQAAATNTDANVNTAKGCVTHLRRLQGIYNALEEMHPDDASDHVKSRAQIELMYFALLRLLDATKVDTAALIANWQQQAIGGAPLHPAHGPRGREYFILPHF